MVQYQINQEDILKNKLMKEKFVTIFKKFKDHNKQIDTISRCKICIMVGQYTNDIIWDFCRISFLIQNKIFFISETPIYIDEYNSEDFKDNIIHSTYVI